MQGFFTMLLALWLWCCTLPAHALTIEIVGGGARQLPVAVVPFVQDVGGANGVGQVIGNDLRLSGLFSVLAAQASEGTLSAADWRGRGADAVVTGSVQALADGRFEVKMRLLDTVQQTTLASVNEIVNNAAQLRGVAHRLADIVYEKLLGVKGIFNSKIIYVLKRGGAYELKVAEFDGANAQTVTRSLEPLISPAWSPDGTRVAYVSFEHKKPVVYVQNLYTGQRQAVANFKGSNSAPAWSPDGNRLAVVLTQDGNSQIYVVNADGSGARRVSHSSAIDTEPNWSPDGQFLLFTSDRGGSPQIYRTSVNGGAAERMTFEGSYNVSPRHSPDGKGFVFVQRGVGGFRIAIQEFATRQVQVLSEGGADASPSFAPNGKLILYASESRGRGALAVVSSDGRIKQRLTEQAGEVREPAWGVAARR